MLQLTLPEFEIFTNAVASRYGRVVTHLLGYELETPENCYISVFFFQLYFKFF